MAYIKTTWVNGETPISATNLNHMETGIEKATNTADGAYEKANNLNETKADTSELTALAQTVANNTTNIGLKYDSSNIEVGTGLLIPNIETQVTSSQYTYTKIGKTITLTVRVVVNNPSNATLQTIHFTTLPFRNNLSFNGTQSAVYSLASTSRADTVLPTRYAISANSTWSNFIRGTIGQSFQDGEILTATITYNIA